jgi:hypothetical protein
MVSVRHAEKETAFRLCMILDDQIEWHADRVVAIKRDVQFVVRRVELELAAFNGYDVYRKFGTIQGNFMETVAERRHAQRMGLARRLAAQPKQSAGWISYFFR